MVLQNPEHPLRGMRGKPTLMSLPLLLPTVCLAKEAFPKGPLHRYRAGGRGGLGLTGGEAPGTEPEGPVSTPHS